MRRGVPGAFRVAGQSKVAYIPGMESVPVETLKEHLDEVLDRAEQGETVTITRDGKPAFELKAKARKGGIDKEGLAAFKRKHGIDKIVAYIAPDFDDPLPEDFLLHPLPAPETGKR